MRGKKKRGFSLEEFVSDSEVALRLSGRVDSAASAVLGPACAKLFEADYWIMIDLTNVPSTDGVGLQLLVALQRVGATLINVPIDIAREIEIASKKRLWSSRCYGSG